MEHECKGQKKGLQAIHVKQKASDPNVATIQAKTDATSFKVEEVSGEVDKLKARMDDMTVAHKQEAPHRRF